MNQTYPEPTLDQREAIHEARATGVHGFVPGLPAVPPGTARNFRCAEATVTKAFHDSEMARMRERCSRLAQMLAEALKG